MDNEEKKYFQKLKEELYNNIVMIVLFITS